MSQSRFAGDEGLLNESHSNKCQSSNEFECTTSVITSFVPEGRRLVLDERHLFQNDDWKHFDGVMVLYFSCKFHNKSSLGQNSE